MLKSKRILSLLLVFVLAFSVCSFAEAMPSGGGLSNFKKVNAYEAGQFTDVAKQWYAGNVQAAYELGLMQGNPDGTFNPTGSIKVIETIVTACRLHSIYHTGKSEFPSGSPWYQPYVDYAVSNGIIGADEYSSYNAPATRAQFISILAKALPKEALQAINSIPKGSLPDVSARTAFADAVYLMYNAGILVGNDDYGTFDPDGNINRAQSAAIITRMADTSLRITKTLKEFDPNPPVSLEVYSYGSRRYTETDSSGKVLVDFWWSEYAPGQRVELLVHMKPALTQSDITWASSDPSVAYVDRYGWLEVCKQGETVITATTDNGVTGSFKIIVPDPGEQLQCELTADGTGYEVTGCDPNAYTAHIPAEYNGLPVVSIRGGAFMGCSKLRYYTVDKRQSVFYEEDGVIFADLPEKTLVCFPPAYDAAQYYYVPEDTVAVAPYGFAGLHANNLSTITMQEGLTTLGHHAFAKVSVQTDIYTPDSLVSIGEYLLQDQTSSLPFYGSADSAMCGYAQENQIPFGRIFDFDPGKNTTMARKPESIPADGMSSDPGVPVKLFSELNYMQYDRWVQTEYDISSYQTDFTGEVYLQLGKQWEAIVPDETGNVSIDMPPQTGLYGVGYTATDAVLRSYDRYGNLLAIQYVNGNFAFCFPGACDLGIVGGSETILSMIPYEPVYLISGGNYPLQADEWYTTEKGSAYQFFIQQYPSSSLQQRMPNHLNIFVAGNYGYGEGTLRSGYQIGFVELYDQSRIDVLTASLSFDGQNCVVDNDEMV